MGGAEDQIVGDWWSDSVFGTGVGDGSRFDGKGGGYDLSYENSDYCVDTDDPIIYRYDGTTLTVYEGDHVVSGTVEETGIDAVTYHTNYGDSDLIKVNATVNCD